MPTSSIGVYDASDLRRVALVVPGLPLKSMSNTDRPSGGMALVFPEDTAGIQASLKGLKGVWLKRLLGNASVLIGPSAIAGLQLRILNYPLDDRFVPVFPELQEKTRTEVAYGANYFVHTGNLESDPNIQAIISAFSAFKKWQQSSMKLVLLSEGEAKTLHPLLQKLGTYKYRHDVVVLQALAADRVADIYAAAYAYIKGAETSFYELEAKACGCPIIETDKLIRIYQDENMRARMADESLATAATWRQEHPLIAEMVQWSAALT